MMQILKLQGTDRQLYRLVGPLVMNPKVLKSNNNYPFKNTTTDIRLKPENTMYGILQ